MELTPIDVAALKGALHERSMSLAQRESAIRETYRRTGELFAMSTEASVAEECCPMLAAIQKEKEAVESLIVRLRVKANQLEEAGESIKGWFEPKEGGDDDRG